MSKILALDLGDQWTGIAITDALKIFAKPYKTVTTQELIPELELLIKQENIDQIILGYPKTLKNQESPQTKKVLDFKNILEEKFPNIKFILWDERFSSQRADSLTRELKLAKNIKSKEEKIKSHSRAAAFILDSYLQSLIN